MSLNRMYAAKKMSQFFGGGSNDGSIIFKGAIAVPSDFPTTAEVRLGWEYIINNALGVTDNDPSKTNTGLTFNDETFIIWTGSTWAPEGAGQVVVDDGQNVTPVSLRNFKVDSSKSFFIGNTDITDLIPSIVNHLVDQGVINLPVDFPTPAEVHLGWFYRFSAGVIDNDPAKTNTGLSFIAGDEAYWNGTTWEILGKARANTAQFNAESYADGKFFPAGSYLLGNTPVTGSDNLLHAIDPVLAGTNVTVTTDPVTGAKTINSTATGGISGIYESNTALVDYGLGNDATGVVGDLAKSFKTYNAVKSLISTESSSNQFNVYYTAGTHMQLGTIVTPFANIIGASDSSSILKNGIDTTPDIIVDNAFDNVDSSFSISNFHVNHINLDLSVLINNRKSATFCIDKCYFYYISYIKGRSYNTPTIYPDKFVINECSSDPTCINSFACGTVNINNSTFPYFLINGSYGEVIANINNSTFSDTLSITDGGVFNVIAIIKGSTINNLLISGTQVSVKIDASSLKNIIISYSGGATSAQINPMLTPGGLRSVADSAARDSIPLDQRVLGMEVVTLNNFLKYRLINEPGTPTTTNSDWETTNIKLVGDNIFIDGINDRINLTSKLSTGLISGGEPSVNIGDNTKTDIAAGVGVIIDRSDIENPIVTIVSWANIVGQTNPYIPLLASSFVGINLAGNAVIKNSDFTDSQIRDIIRLGNVSHFNRTSITGTSYMPVFYNDDIDQAYQSMAFGTTLLDGGVLSANGANLKLNKSLAVCRRWGGNAGVSSGGDLNNPHTTRTPADSAFSFRTVYREALATASVVSLPVSDIDPIYYDNASGTLQVVPAGYYTIQTVVLFPYGTAQDVMIIYGQNVYSTLAQTQNRAGVDYPVILQDISGGVIIGRIIVRQDVTNLSAAIAANTAQLLRGNIFGTSSAGGGGGGGGSLSYPIGVYPVATFPIAGSDGNLTQSTIPLDTYFTTGVVDRSKSTLAFVDGTRTFTIAPTGTDFTIYSGSNKIIKTSSSIVITNVVGVHYIYFKPTGALSAGTVPWSIVDNTVPIAIIYWDGTKGAVSDERHSAGRNLQWHAWAHDTIGTRYESGLLASTLSTSATTIDSGVIHDEDIEITIAQQVNAVRVWYRNTISTMTFDSAASTITAKVITGALQYDNAGTLAAVSNNNYATNWLYATTDKDYPIYCVVSQAQYTTITNARAASLPTFPNIKTREYKLIYQVIWRNAGGTPTFIESTDYRSSSTIPGAGTPLINASAVTLTPFTNVTATNVQSGLEQLGTAIYQVPLNNQTANYTLVLTDASKLVEMNVATANTVTVPTNASVAFPIGTVIAIVQQGVGKVSVAGAGGVTVRTAATLNLRAQYSGASLLKRATDEWYLTGDLEAV